MFTPYHLIAIIFDCISYKSCDLKKGIYSMKAVFFTLLIISFGFTGLVAAQSEPEENYDEDDLYGEDFYDYNNDSSNDNSNNESNDVTRYEYDTNYGYDGSTESQVGNFVRFLLARESAIPKFEINLPDGTEQKNCSTDEAPAVNKQGKLGSNVCTSCYYSNGGFSLSCGFKPLGN